MKQTALYPYHKANAKTMEFAGYEMPLWYTSISEEHMAVRDHAGIFDVSHMGRIEIAGPQADRLLDVLVPAAASGQPVGRSFYTLLLNEDAGIVDDLIVIKRSHGYLLVVNAANLEKDLKHIRERSATYEVDISDMTTLSSMVAIQGPESARIFQPLTAASLAVIRKFENVDSSVDGLDATITRTGYTGEDGFEVIFHDTRSPDAVLTVWRRLAELAKPCGLGARDSLRLEAGLPLYGSDMDEATNPVEAGLQWVVSKENEGYIGHDALKAIESTPPSRVRRGLLMDDGIPRKDFQVADEDGTRIGVVTSGTFSPLLKRGIALAYLKSEHSGFGRSVLVSVRATPARACVTKTPFYDERRYGWKRAHTQTDGTKLN